MPSPLTVRALARVLLVAACVPLAARAQETPSPQALAARHDSLIGGRAALDGHRSMRMRGSFAIPEMGLDAPLEILKLRPNRYLFRATLGPMGEILSGYDGANAWAVQPGQGALVLQGEQAAQVATQADFFGDLHDYTRFATVETLAQEEFEGKRAWPVRMIRASGDTLLEFFDVESGLSIGSRTAVTGPMGRVESTSVVGDYRDFHGLRVATRIEQRNAMLRLVITIADVEFDTLAEADLEPPEAVRALLKPPARP